MIREFPSRLTLAISVMGMALGCNTNGSAGPRTTAKAGIFYGGQIQNRAEWPLVLDATRQSQGFRIEFGRPLTKATQVNWEIVRPAFRKKIHSNKHEETVESSFSASVPVGSERFDQIVAFTDSDRTGEWKLRVSVDGVRVLERTIHVVTKPPPSTED